MSRESRSRQRGASVQPQRNRTEPYQRAAFANDERRVQTQLLSVDKKAPLDPQATARRVLAFVSESDRLFHDPSNWHIERRHVHAVDTDLSDGVGNLPPTSPIVSVRWRHHPIREPLLRCQPQYGGITLRRRAPSPFHESRGRRIRHNGRGGLRVVRADNRRRGVDRVDHGRIRLIVLQRGDLLRQSRQ